MNIIVHKPRWNNNEWTFNFIPYFSMTKISHYAFALHFGWLFWGISISNIV